MTYLMSMLEVKLMWQSFPGRNGFPKPGTKHLDGRFYGQITGIMDLFAISNLLLS